ncbi:DUF6086 family protein [Streptomyces sp. NPDC054841]
MSQYFDMGDETLWNPSNGASRLFLRHVAVFEEELGLPSGIGPMVADECQVDPAAFEIFVNALLAEHRRTRHRVMLALSDGFVATMVVLAERARVNVRWTPPDTAPGEGLRDVQVPMANWDEAAWADRLRRKARELDRFMAL